MPDYLLYVRHKNSKMGKRLFNGEPIKATDQEAAKTKALHRDHSLRRSRLLAVLAPAIKEVIATVPEHVEGLTPEEMVNALKPKSEIV